MLSTNGNQKGFSLLELILGVTIIAILTSIAVPNIIAASKAARESRAIANIKTINYNQQAFYAIHNKFALIAELFQQNYLADKQFARISSNKENSPKFSPTEIMSDGYYDYSFRYSVNADGYTLDADPKKALATKYRFFRYRVSRLNQDKLSGNMDIVFFALPRKDSLSPPTSAYKPLN